jgi:hypothetical protein
MSKKPPTASRFIADSSPAGNETGVRRESMTQSNTGASSLYEESSKGYCVGLGFSVWCIRSKYWEYFCRHAHPCASEKGKPVVRR